MYLGIGIGLSAQSIRAPWSPLGLFAGGDMGFCYPMVPGVTLFQDASGTVPVSAPGDPVGRCRDMSGKGNHLSQSTALNRPIYARHPRGGRRNLLADSVLFNTGWSAQRTTLNPSAASASDGSMTAAQLVETAEDGTHRRFVNLAKSASALEYSCSVELKAGTRNFATLRLAGAGEVSAASFGINLTTGEISASVSNGFTVLSRNATLTTAGWWRVTLSVLTDATTSLSLLIGIANSLTHSASYVGDGLSYIQVARPQLELGSTATAYQKVTSQYDVIEAGVPSLNHLSFNGTNQWMVSPTINWGSDRASLCAGQRKTGDALAYLLEFSSSFDSNAGAFNVTAPSGSGMSNYTTQSRGDAAANTNQRGEITGAASPDSAVISCRHDIAGDLTEFWRNGVKAANASGEKGAGSFGSYPLYIGGRAGTSGFFTGNLYALTGINCLLSATELAQLESWTASCTGVTL